MKMGSSSPTKHAAGDISAPFRLERNTPVRQTPATSKKQMPISSLKSSAVDEAAHNIAEHSDGEKTVV
jgi:hypothetical protein